MLIMEMEKFRKHGLVKYCLSITLNSCCWQLGKEKNKPCHQPVCFI